MIFGIRSVRRMLDGLSSCLDVIRISELEGRLALENSQTRAAEWEVAIGYALSQVGTLVDFGVEQHGNPDFIWTPEQQPITVEVTSISDSSLHDHNPVDDFSAEINRMATKVGINQYGVMHFNLGSVENESRITLGMPAKQDFVRFFGSPEIKVFFATIKHDLLHEHIFTFEERGAMSTITYCPGQRYSGGGYRSYAIARSYRHSPVFNALRKKEKQIRDSCLQHPAILFICDNDCDALSPSFGNRMGRVGMRDIVGLFLNGQQHRQAGPWVLQEGVPAKGRKIHAVVWIAVHQEQRPILGVRRNIRLVADVEYATYAALYLKTPEFIELLNRALAFLPTPTDTPRNASHKRSFPRFYGGYTMTEQSIKFSALTLQKLLAGEITYVEFVRDHPELVAHIKHMSDQGMMLDHTEFESCKNEDDDWVILRFGNIRPDRLFKKRLPN